MSRFSPFFQRRLTPPRRQRGVALFVIIVFVLLSMLLALWASRTAFFNELVVGNDADYQRAFEAAQALLQDAELDIRNERGDGFACTPDPNNDKICRRRATLAQVPLATEEVGGLLAELSNQTTHCLNGLCAKRNGRQDFWNYTNATSPTPGNLQPGEVPLESLTATDVGARYGEYTGASLGNASNPINAILADRGAANQGGWYWIEVLPYDESAKNAGVVIGNNNLLALNTVPNVVYRITALAYGRKPSTMVVLQQTYARQKRKD